MVDRLSKARRSWNMSRIKGRDTAPERKLRSLLHKAGYRFRIHRTTLPGKPDIVLRKYRTVVFVHGCFWHRHEDCPNAANPKTNAAFWQEKFRNTVERDRRNSAVLADLGWRIVVVWECEIERDAAKVAGRVGQILTGVEHGV